VQWGSATVHGLHGRLIEKHSWCSECTTECMKSSPCEDVMSVLAGRFAGGRLEDGSDPRVEDDPPPGRSVAGVVDGSPTGAWSPQGVAASKLSSPSTSVASIASNGASSAVVRGEPCRTSGSSAQLGKDCYPRI
jgi:hypothetical protein